MGTLSDLVAASSASGPVSGFDLSLRLTSRTIGTPIAAVLPEGADAPAAIAAFDAGARLIEIDSFDAALRAAIVLELVRASGRVAEENSFGAPFLFVRLPSARDAVEAMLEEVSRSAGARYALAAELTEEQARFLGPMRPLTAVTFATNLDEAGEAFAKSILQEWGDDLVLALDADASPAPIVPALDRLRAVAESAGCTLVLRVPATAPAALLAALSGSAAAGIPVWLSGVAPPQAPSAIVRGASLVSPGEPRDVAATFRALGDPAWWLGTRRISDLVLFGPEPDAAIRAAAEAQFGAETWLVAPVKNSVLALRRLTDMRGGTLDSPLIRLSLADPPKECCLYKEEVPDLKEAATGWFYERWVRETMRRRLPIG